MSLEAARPALTRLETWLVALLLLMPFLSKITLRALGLPDRFGLIWWQGGLHPVMNSVLTTGLLFALGILFIRRSPSSTSREKIYLSVLIAFMAVMGVQAILQAAFQDLNVNLLLHFSGLALTSLLIFGYGWLVPRLGAVGTLFQLLTVTVRVLLAVSFLILLLRPEFAFKGSRFIGVFKHIPYMVTCAQLGLLVEWNNIVSRCGWRRVLAGFFLMLAWVGIALTGTRSAALCGLVFLLLAAYKWPIKSEGMTWLRRGLVYLSLVFAVTLGPFAASALESFLRGESSFLLRPAQDGIASRLEEVERGWATVEKSPLLGQGLLYRFGSESMETAGSYNSFRDPHNIFVSAGVIGGWPLIIVLSLALGSLGAFLISRLRGPVRDQEDYQVLLLSIYLLSHLPILLVYHLHLSLGGLADRIYWLFMGCVFSARTAKSSEEHV
ncbi:MAG: O-antigen ligase family protein [Bdellovibrionaceae bacterium]|nr:O-antigen ligase family protein [Pseudobdellovibrionaceae bacterium]